MPDTSKHRKKTWEQAHILLSTGETRTEWIRMIRVNPKRQNSGITPTEMTKHGGLSEIRVGSPDTISAEDIGDLRQANQAH